MAGLIALSGRDVIAALLVGGFRIARRERGLVLVVRDSQMLVVPEDAVLQRPRLLALLERGGVQERELLTWMSAAHGFGRPKVTRSGFHRRPASGAQRSLDDLVQHTKDARARADAAHGDARTALAASREVLDRLRVIPGDDGRIQAVQESLARWHEALREVEAEEARERQRKER